MENDKYSALAFLKETEGERVIQALKKIYNRMHDLEKSKQRRRKRVESLNGHMGHPSADEFNRKLANAEAQCILLEEQLISVRNIIAGFSPDKAEEESSYDILSVFPSIPNVPHALKTPEELPQKNALNGTIQSYLQSEPSSSNYPISKERKRESFKKQWCENYPSISNLQANYNEKPLSSKISSRKYHINVKSMPFVSATTSSKSHSLRANIQTVYSMVKHCNPTLCQGTPFHRKRSLSAERQRSFYDKGQQLRRSNSVDDISRLHDYKPRYSRVEKGKCSHPESEFEIDLLYSRNKYGMSEAQKRKIFLRDLKSVNFYVNKAT